MNPLNIRDAYRLYTIMNPHFPKENMESFKAINETVNHIVKTGKETDLIEIFAIMNGVDSDTILKDMQPEDGIGILLQGFVESRVFSLMEFFRGFDT